MPPRPTHPPPSPPARLELLALRAGAELPDIQPGALPRLESLHVRLEHQQSAAPPSWGAPGALPSLQHFTLVLLSFAAPLPVQWAQGFRGVREILLMCSVYRHPDSHARAPLPPDEAEALARAPPLRVPPEWGAGFPALVNLHISAVVQQTAAPAPRIEDLLPPQGLSTLEDL